jgi:hypothetical protein
VADNGQEVWFDPGLVVEHKVAYTTGAYAPGRGGDWSIRFENSSFNLGFVISKHSSKPFQRFCRLIYLLAIGSSSTPGPLLLPLCLYRNHCLLQELRLIRTCLAWKWAGWRAGLHARQVRPL